MARVPTPMNWTLVTPEERRAFIESHSWSSGGLASIEAEEAEANAEWARRRDWWKFWKRPSGLC
jgi:hypothetical protein